jgi:pilus assembly protein Flp/PilA
MKKITQSFKAFLADEHGATAIEYGLLASLIAVAIIVPVGLIGTDLAAVFTTIATAL